MNAPDKLEQILRLASRGCESELQPEEAAQLEALLLDDPVAQRAWVLLLEQDLQLTWLTSSGVVAEPEDEQVEEPAASYVEEIVPSDAEGPVVPLSPRPTVVPSQRTPVLGFLANVSRRVPGGEFTVGSLLLLVIVAAFWGLSQAILYPRLGGGRDLAQESSHLPTVPSSDRAEGVAMIRETDNVEWSGSREASLPPAIRRGEALRIDSGLIELQLTGGTTLLIEGPADWKINGENSATLTHGKLIARVPQQAIGFTLETPHGSIIDLGTEFGVEVSPSGSEVQVIKGLVDVQGIEANGKGKSNTVKAGQSVQITKSGPTTPKDSPTVTGKFKRLVETGNKPKHEEVLNPTTGLVAYYPFDGDTRDHAAEYEANSGKAADNLTINGSHEFLAGQVGKGLRLTGGYAAAPVSADVNLAPTFTIEAWTVAETLAPTYQRLVLSWSEKPTAYVYHFSIKGKGIELGIGQADGTLVFAAGGELKSERWQHVAGVADGSRLHVYIDGEEVAVRDFGGTLFPNQREGLGIGDSARGEVPGYRFHGSLDELAIWNVALSPEQIAFHARRGTRGYELPPKVKTATTLPKTEK